MISGDNSWISLDVKRNLKYCELVKLQASCQRKNETESPTVTNSQVIEPEITTTQSDVNKISQGLRAASIQIVFFGHRDIKHTTEFYKHLIATSSTLSSDASLFHARMIPAKKRHVLFLSNFNSHGAIRSKALCHGSTIDSGSNRDSLLSCRFSKLPTSIVRDTNRAQLSTKKEGAANLEKGYKLGDTASEGEEQTPNKRY